jgi:N-acetylglucosamine malate deacetylase 1
MANIVIFGPHPDDQEIGMGGSIAKLAERGHDVLIVDVTDGSPTPKGDRATRLPEAAAALAALQPSAEAMSRGVRPARPIKRILLDLPNRRVEHTLHARHVFAGAIRAHQASIVFAPWEVDAHPDHRAVTRIAEDARFDAKLTKVDMPVPPGGVYSTIGPPIYPKWFLYYHISHLRATISPSFLLDITGFEQKKLASVKAYASQFGPFVQPRPGDEPFAKGDNYKPDGPELGRLVSPTLPERLLSYSAYMGSLIGVAHAEGFTTKEPIGLDDLAALV